MAKEKPTFEKLMKEAEKYHVDQNALFVSACQRYTNQVEMIGKIQEQINRDGLMIEHTNVKGDVNSDVNPLTVQLPKYIDTANKTLNLMLDIIQRLGTVAVEEDVNPFDCE